MRKLNAQTKAIAKRAGVKVTWTIIQQTASVDCDPTLANLMRKATARHEREVLALPSGAGHDAAAIAAICPVSMLFLRCKGGISHHPDESVKTADVAKGHRGRDRLHPIRRGGASMNRAAINMVSDDVRESPSEAKKVRASSSAPTMTKTMPDFDLLIRGAAPFENVGIADGKFVSFAAGSARQEIDTRPATVAR